MTNVKRVAHAGRCGATSGSGWKCRKRTRTLVYRLGHWEFRCNLHMPKRSGTDQILTAAFGGDAPR